MELKRKALCFLSLVLWFQAFSVLQCIGQTQNKYVDENLPRGQARIFAPGIVSMPRGEGFYEERPVFSPDFKEVYFDLTNYKDKTFTSLHMRYENGKWTSPEPAFFTKYKGFQPTISADGKRSFAATLPLAMSIPATVSRVVLLRRKLKHARKSFGFSPLLLTSTCPAQISSPYTSSSQPTLCIEARR